MSVVDTNQNVISRIQDVGSMVDAAMAGQAAFLESIQNAATVQPPSIVAPFAMFTPAPPVVDATVPARPTEVNDILTATEAQVPAEPGIVTNFGIAFPTGLDDIEFPNIADFSFAEREYVSDLLTTVSGKLKSDVEIGGTGLSATEEDAIWRRDEERMELARQEAIDNTIDEWAGRGFSLPDGAVNDAVIAVNEKHRMDRLSRGRDITIKSADLTLQNKWKAIESAIGLEGILISHHDQVLNRALQAAVSVLQLGADIVRTQVAVVTGKIEAYKSELDSRVAIERFKLEKYTTAVNVYAKKIDAALGRARSYIDLYHADTQVYSAVVQKAAEIARLLTQQGAIASETLQASVRVALEAAKTNLQAFIQAAEIRMTAATAGAKIYEAQIAAAQSSLTTVIQLAASGETIATETGA